VRRQSGPDYRPSNRDGEGCRFAVKFAPL
jgi:hypothetical protein